MLKDTPGLRKVGRMRYLDRNGNWEGCDEQPSPLDDATYSHS